MKNLTSILLTLIILSCSEKQDTKSPESNPQKPNIIFILADDMGYGDLSSLNPDSKIATPHMDMVVEQGVHFTDAHSNSAVCTPTRYGILTGRYAWRSRLKDGVLWGYDTPLIEEGRPTVASFLKDNGYQTACIGKWHLGLGWQKKDTTKDIADIKWADDVPRGVDDNVDYSQKVTGGPDAHGFDYSFVIPASLDMSPYLYVRNGYATQEPTGYTEGKSQEADGRGVFWREGKVAPDFEFDQVLPTIIDSATYFIYEKANQENPFFLYLPLASPHTPWLPTAHYQGKSSADTYGDFVEMTDDMIGRVLNQVKESGISQNTLIIITSDNGCDWRPSDIKETGHLGNLHFKGRKADIYEAGHRVPYLALWPGVIPAGLKSDQILCTTDLMATIGGILKKAVPAGGGEDSYNLWPAYTSNVETPIRESIIHHSLNGFFAIRKGKWKYTPHLGSGGFSDPKTIQPKEGEPMGTLYNMYDDVSETTNLYGQYPDVVRELAALLEKHKSEGYTK
jgi:arylsulfatase A-like enzyme